ncbi:hypothetical protein ACWEP4_40610 [Streptomyces sp. NPDC004227]
MNIIDVDGSLAASLGHVREIHDPIRKAIEDGEEITAIDCALLSGAVSALLDAIDARLPRHEAQPAIKAVAA